MNESPAEILVASFELKTGEAKQSGSSLTGGGKGSLSIHSRNFQTSPLRRIFIKTILFSHKDKNGTLLFNKIYWLGMKQYLSCLLKKVLNTLLLDACRHDISNNFLSRFL